MKIFSLSCFLILLQVTVLKAQVIVEDKDINQLEIIYCKIWLDTSPLLDNRISVSVDYGQEVKWPRRFRIRHEDGSLFLFHSMVDALNFMEVHGWTLVDLEIDSSADTSTTYYLLRKKDGPVTRRTDAMNN